MRIEKLELNNYRNIENTLLLPHPNVNIIFGKNQFVGVYLAL